MKRAFTLFCICAFGAAVAAQQPRKLKVFISVDMEGVSGVVTGDQTYAGGVLAHTGSGSVADLRINGRSVGEAGMNMLAAGALGVPVVMVTGDQEAVAQARELVPNIEGVQVKEAIGTTAALSLHPETARTRIREAAARALKRLSEFKPAPPSTPATFEVRFTQTALADVAEQIPTVKRVDAQTVSYQANDYLQGYRLLRVLYRYLRAD